MNRKGGFFSRLSESFGFLTRVPSVDCVCTIQSSAIAAATAAMCPLGGFARDARDARDSSSTGYNVPIAGRWSLPVISHFVHRWDTDRLGPTNS